mgnify:CR=1 FL=1
MTAFYIKDGEMYEAEEFEASNTVTTADNVVITPTTSIEPSVPKTTKTGEEG